MKKDRKQRLEKLMSLPSPTGSETPVTRAYTEMMAEISQEVISDCMGNTTVVLSPKNPCGSIMLAGHADEIGLMIKYIDDKGFVYVTSLGGIDPDMLKGKRITFHTMSGKEVLGLIEGPCFWERPSEKRNVKLKWDEIYVDIGAKNKKDALKMVEIGDVGVINQTLEYMPNNLVAARAFDDRIGVFVIAEVLLELKKKMKKLNLKVYGTATTQEEIGCRGAITSAFNLNPDLAIAIDVDSTSDYPNADKKKLSDISLGKGGIIAKGPNLHPVITNALEKIGSKKKIPYQLKAQPRPTPTDASEIQVSAGGVPTALVSVPTRYIHDPCELVSLTDLDNIISLLAEYILSIGKLPEFRF